MKIGINTYLRLIEITGGIYNASKINNGEEVLLIDLDNAIEDLITEFGVIEELYSDMREKTIEIKDKVEEKLFLINMVDRWDREDSLAFDLRKQEIEDLEEILGVQRSNDR